MMNTPQMNSSDRTPELLRWRPEYSETLWPEKFIERLRALEWDVIVADAYDMQTNLALDTNLLYDVASGKTHPTMWVWDWKESGVVLGSYQSVSNEIDADFAHAHGFTFGRRMSGGGAMVVEPGKTITYSIIVPETVVQGLSFIQSFAFLDHWCVLALRSLGIPATYRPINDIASPTAKIGGAAQCRRQKTLLHHTTLAYQIDEEFMFRLLRLKQPRKNAKGIPSAVKRVTPLCDFTLRGHDEIRSMLVHTFEQLFRSKLRLFTERELQRAATLVEEKFSTHEWLYRVE